MMYLLDMSKNEFKHHLVIRINESQLKYIINQTLIVGNKSKLKITKSDVIRTLLEEKMKNDNEKSNSKKIK
jgi:hypothetical protein